MAARPVWACCVTAAILASLILLRTADTARAEESAAIAGPHALWQMTKEYLDRGYLYLQFLERCRLRGRMQSPQAVYLGILLACPVERGDDPQPPLQPPVTWEGIEPLLSALATKDSVTTASVEELRQEVRGITGSVDGLRGDVRLIFCGQDGAAPDRDGCLEEEPRPIVGSLISHFKPLEPTMTTRLVQPTLDKLVYPVATGIISSILVVLLAPSRKRNSS